MHSCDNNFNSLVIYSIFDVHCVTYRVPRDRQPHDLIMPNSSIEYSIESIICTPMLDIDQTMIIKFNYNVEKIVLQQLNFFVDAATHSSGRHRSPYLPWFSKLF